jgi:hypothetical protein
MGWQGVRQALSAGQITQLTRPADDGSLPPEDASLQPEDSPLLAELGRNAGSLSPLSGKLPAFRTAPVRSRRYESGPPYLPTFFLEVFALRTSGRCAR